ncbi:MAG: hypothetical protein CSA23_04955 [Deltaproteobacteria bacterium]|nr:MAG: hypothetical protein CSA23_04955 [Deltaproteobacteria bacterium]
MKEELYLPGDIFVVYSGTFFARTINRVQQFWDVDGQAKFNHAGVIIDADGTTIEALRTIQNGNIYNYKDHLFMVGRPYAITDEKFQVGYDAIKGHLGQSYPWWRLFLHVFPPAARHISTGNFPVCSELVAKFLHAAGYFPSWKGITPDVIADRIKYWGIFKEVPNQKT